MTWVKLASIASWHGIVGRIVYELLRVVLLMMEGLTRLCMGVAEPGIPLNGVGALKEYHDCML